MVKEYFFALPVYASRLIYGINWFAITPAFILIESQLHLSELEIGFVATSFFAGLMPFQFIGGILASRISPRFIVIIGLFLIGLFSILTGESENFLEIFMSHMSVGIGSALFSSPALALLSDGQDSRTVSRRTGIYNALFGIGSGIGITGWIIIDSITGWRISMFISGILALAVIPFMFRFTESNGTVYKSRDVPVTFKKIIMNKYRWMLGFSAGIGALSETVIGQMFVYYSEKTKIMSPLDSGITVSIYFIMGIFGGYLYGRHFGMSHHKTFIYVFTAIVTSLLFISIPAVSNLYILTGVVWIIGALTVALLTMLYYTVMSIDRNSRSMSFSLGFNNFMQKIIAVASPALFVYIALNANYSYSWYILGISGLILVFLYPGIYKNFNITGTD
ncbi:MAG: MFS transporter [Ferroplasma sp.]|uniref:MFS transporter n=1 Tax=Ferroplasma sp. TaxID=2591003 RepID=UPI0028162336|nr:MFS transporter [Ferroplasma sp.]WMT51035.1 MAG: MFS transporter [Ferroplasma sp.]